MMKLISQARTTAQGGNATTQSPPTNSTRPTDQELQNAARELRAAFKNNINAEVVAARAQAAAEAAQAAAGQAAPLAQRTFTIRGPNGEQTVVGVPDPFRHNDAIPPQAVDISVAFFITVAAIIIGLPLARAFARRMDRRSGPNQIPPEITSQLTQLNQAVDAIALEVERISEGQRYTTRLLSEQRDAHLPAATQR